MTLQIHSNYLCLPVHKGCLVSDYDERNGTWKNVNFLQPTEIPNSCDVQVECCAFSPCGKYLAVCCSKYLMIYTTSNWSFLSSAITDRKGVSVRFFPKSNNILLAEKSGNIKFFKFYENKIEKIDIGIGHNSMLFDVLVTKDEKFIITCDKDEKIRVTNYPNVYNIQCYCLGHTQFVCSINILQSHENILISSSGDKTVRLWDISTGKELSKFVNTTAIKNESANNTGFYVKITSLAIDKNQSLVAALELNANDVTLLKVTGNIENYLNMELFKIIKHNANPFDVEFWQGNLICLLQDEKNPIKVYSSKNNFAESNDNFKNLSCKLNDYWSSILLACQKRAYIFPSIFQYKKSPDSSFDDKSKKARIE